MSGSKKARRRGAILDEIMAYHREQLPKIMREVPLANVRAFASVAPPTTSLYSALLQPGVSLIAECKRASPSKGLMVPDYDPVELAQTYVRAGASAISVLTDARHFQGSLSHLRDVKESISDSRGISVGNGDSKAVNGVPVLRKDFVFHPYQIYEARAAGADAVLLIASVLSGSELSDLMALTHELAMDALVEVHTEPELERVLNYRPRIIGINNRDLQTFEVDFGNTARLRSRVPEKVLVVGESGIKRTEDVHRMRELGVDAILVGETLVRSRDVFESTNMLVKAGRP